MYLLIIIHIKNNAQSACLVSKCPFYSAYHWGTSLTTSYPNSNLSEIIGISMYIEVLQP